MAVRYPASEWTQEALQAKRDELLSAAEREAGEERYLEAADLRADARELGALLVRRGAKGRELEIEEAWFGTDMAKVIAGEGPSPRIVTSRRWDTRVKFDLVLDDPDANLTALEQWNRAGRYAIPYYFTWEEKEALGLSLIAVSEPEFGFSATASEKQLADLEEGVEENAGQEPELEAASEPGRDDGPELG
jgi:hypothetical protein